ncbi:MAG: prepilin-type N-terminal cleavage/methylation domain-containing protein [Phycisphaeraceae bacterium]|nr:prepilin-type N-terminal cleavage/methylation domain-containing protein [Phycisphaeraceae bacterium]
MKQYSNRSGMTLIEVMVATVLIGIALSAMVGANGYITQVNRAGCDLSVAESLLEHIKEKTEALPVVDPDLSIVQFATEEADWALYDDLDDFDGASFCPPIDARGNVLNQWSTFTQQVAVQNVQIDDLTTPVADLASNFYRVTVTILHEQRPVTSGTWIRCLYSELE